MKKTNVDTETLKQVYQTLQRVNLKATKKGDWKAITARLPAQTRPKSDQECESKFRLLTKVAKQVSEKEFIDSAISGQIPTVKLTSKEMDQLRGGFGWATWVGLGIAVAERSPGGALLFMAEMAEFLYGPGAGNDRTNISTRTGTFASESTGVAR